MKGMMALVLVLLVVLIFGGLSECKNAKVLDQYSSEYSAMSCREHTASITDFGGIGDGTTSNTKAFQAAINHLAEIAADGSGAQLFVPPGKWLTGSFNLTSHFTLFLHKDAVLLASQDESDYPIIVPLPSYGRGRDGKEKDATVGRYSSLIFGTNLTDVIVTGENGTINGQGALWWKKYKKGQLKYTRPYLIEILHSDQVQISDLTLLDSPSWNVHPVYSSNVIIKGLTIIAPTFPVSPNTDGINPDSCSNVLIEDCYIVSGDDCVAVKSGWDEYGISYAMPTQHLIIRRLTCISPDSAVIALGSEMSGGIQDVRAEDITAIHSESGIRIKTAVGRGGFVKDIFVRRMTMQTMKWAFWMTGNYGSHADDRYDPKALPVIQGISYSDMVAENVTMAARLEGIDGDPFTGICISNVTIGMAAKAKKVPWTCTDVSGGTNGVSPSPCDSLPGQAKTCPFPAEALPIENVELKACSLSVPVRKS